MRAVTSPKKSSPAFRSSPKQLLEQLPHLRNPECGRDLSIRQAHSSLWAKSLRTTPCVPYLLKEITQTYPRYLVSEDWLRRRLRKLSLSFDSIQRFEQELLKKVMFLLASKGPKAVTIKNARREMRAHGVDISQALATRTWYALRRRDP